jgi:hypothetical protein
MDTASSLCVKSPGASARLSAYVVETSSIAQAPHGHFTFAEWMDGQKKRQMENFLAGSYL